MRELVVVLLVGLLLGAGLTWAVKDRELAAWRGRADVEMARGDSALVVLAAVRDSARRAGDAAAGVRVDTLVLVRERWRVDTLAAAVELATSLDACQTAGRALAEGCRRMRDSAMTVVDSALLRSARYEQGMVTALRADSLSRLEVERWRRLVEAVPSPPGKWLGFLPRPGVTAGLGCAGGWQFGCGIAVVAGFTF